MPRKYFRKYLPSHASVRSHRFVACFGPLLKHHNLWHLHRRSVAGGVAVGLFCGLIPGPFQMLGAAILAIAFRVNLPVAVFTTLYTNPFTIVPLYLAAYKLGALVTGAHNSGAPAAALELSAKPIGEWLPAIVAWFASLGKPLAVGLPLLALLLAVAGYFAVRFGWRAYLIAHWHRRHRARLKRELQKTLS